MHWQEIKYDQQITSWCFAQHRSIKEAVQDPKDSKTNGSGSMKDGVFCMTHLENQCS